VNDTSDDCIADDGPDDGLLPESHQGKTSSTSFLELYTSKETIKSCSSVRIRQLLFSRSLRFYLNNIRVGTRVMDRSHTSYDFIADDRMLLRSKETESHQGQAFSTSFLELYTL